MSEQLSRTERILGAGAMARLRRSRVAVFGAGGVGGFVIEALSRSGLGALDIIDSDTVALSNLNRQIIATRSTVGRLKVDAFAERIADIDPEVCVRTYPVFYLPDSEEAALFNFKDYDYVVDAIDTVAAKIDIILRAQEAGVPVISSMGCGNRIDPGKLAIMDLSKTSMDPLARTMRRELKKRGVAHVKVLCSSESPLRPVAEGPADGQLSGSADERPKRMAPGSTAFVPASAGLMIAAEVVRDLSGIAGV